MLAHLQSRHCLFQLHLAARSSSLCGRIRDVPMGKTQQTAAMRLCRSLLSRRYCPKTRSSSTCFYDCEHRPRLDGHYTASRRPEVTPEWKTEEWIPYVASYGTAVEVPGCRSLRTSSSKPFKILRNSYNKLTMKLRRL
jgi:hypothetical protein